MRIDILLSLTTDSANGCSEITERCDLCSRRKPIGYVNTQITKMI